jgi:hypothetical protein
LAKKRTYHASKVFHGVKKRHKLKKLAFYTTVKNRRNFEHFFDDGAIFITPTVLLIKNISPDTLHLSLPCGWLRCEPKEDRTKF